MASSICCTSSRPALAGDDLPGARQVIAAAPPPTDKRTINKPAKGSSTVWISAQPVSRFAPPETWATVHA
jgi:hypothetical protein